MRKETEEWVKIAVEEIESAKCLFGNSLFRMVCYHCQQGVEKLLKSILVEHKNAVPRIHNLLDLKNAVKELGFNTPISDENTVFLNSVYRFRYPSDLGLLPWGEPGREDAQKAMDIANGMLKWFRVNEPFSIMNTDTT
ncbi:MAG: HEPN domain-containing protein [Candidatus Anammoxibacter sp.]